MFSSECGAARVPGRINPQPRGSSMRSTAWSSRAHLPRAWDGSRRRQCARDCFASIPFRRLTAKADGCRSHAGTHIWVRSPGCLRTRRCSPPRAAVTGRDAVRTRDNQDSRWPPGSGVQELLVIWIANPSHAHSRTESRVSVSSDQDTRTGAIAADHATHPSTDSAMATAQRKSQKRTPRAGGRYKGGGAIF